MAAPLIPYVVDVDQQVARAAEYAALPVRRWIDHQPRVLDAAEEGLKGGVHFQARQ
jgi:hypothetical protein